MKNRTALIRADITGSDIAEAAGVRVKASAPVLALCRELLAEGYNPETRLEAFRGTMLCLVVHSIGAGAKLSVDERDTRFCRWKAFLSPAVPSPVRARADLQSPSLKSALASMGTVAQP